MYEPPVPIRQLADELGVGMSLLHRQVRFGKIPVVPVGNQVCVTPQIAQKIKAWREAHPAFTRWPDFTKPDLGDVPDGDGLAADLAEGLAEARAGDTVPADVIADDLRRRREAGEQPADAGDEENS